jgi:hypothetical protein
MHAAFIFYLFLVGVPVVGLLGVVVVAALVVALATFE